MPTEGSSFTQPCRPKFDGDYEHWSMLMKNLLRLKEYWSLIKTGHSEPGAAETLTAVQRKTLEDLKLKDLKVKNFLFQAIDKTILKTILQKGTSKQLWDSIKRKFQGNVRVHRAQLQALRRDFEMLEMKVGESVTDYFSRVMLLANDMRNYGEDMQDVKIVEKILRTLIEKFNYIVWSIEESKDIDRLSVDELQSSLIVHEQKFRRTSGPSGEEQALNVAFEEGIGRGGKGVVEVLIEAEEEEEADRQRPLWNVISVTSLDTFNLSAQAETRKQIMPRWKKWKRCYSWLMWKKVKLEEKMSGFRLGVQQSHEW